MSGIAPLYWRRSSWITFKDINELSKSWQCQADTANQIVLTIHLEEAPHSRLGVTSQPATLLLKIVAPSNEQIIFCPLFLLSFFLKCSHRLFALKSWASTLLRFCSSFFDFWRLTVSLFWREITWPKIFLRNSLMTGGWHKRTFRNGHRKHASIFGWVFQTLWECHKCCHFSWRLPWISISVVCLSFLSMKIHLKAKVLSEEFALVQLGMFLHSVSDARLIRN